MKDEVFLLYFNRQGMPVDTHYLENAFRTREGACAFMREKHPEYDQVSTTGADEGVDTVFEILERDFWYSLERYPLLP